MPELPEVEVRKIYIGKNALGRPIARASVLDKRILFNTTAAALARGLRGTELLRARRRGKYVLVETDRADTLLFHFGMTGELLMREKGKPKPRWSRVELHFEDGSCLHYINMRLIGKVALYPTTDMANIPDIAGLGPEPLDRSFTFEKFRGIVKGHNTTIHQLLMDQELIAGIGNIYSDEITFQAGVRPDRKTGSLADKEILVLYDEMKRVLRRSIQLGAELDDHPGEFIIPHRDKKGECPRCHGPLVKKTIGGRSSYFCPVCQK